MSSTHSSLDAALKQLYRNQNLGDTTYKRHPMFAALPKFEGFYGRNMPLVVKYGNGAGGGGTFSDAQSNVSSLLYQDFTLTHVNMYQVAQIDGDALDMTASDAGSFIKGLKEKIDSSMAALADQLETYIPRDGNGWLATVGAVSSGSLTISDIDDVQVFEVGMSVYSVDEADKQGAPQNSGASEVIAGVNRSTGVLTATSTNWTDTLASVDADDYICVEGYAYGDTGPTGAAGYKVIAGFEGWVPETAPGATAWFGVARNTDTRLGGSRHDGSSQLVEEAIIDGESIAAAEGGAPGVCFLHHTSNRKLVKEIGSKANYDRLSARGAEGPAKFGFRSIVLDGSMGPIQVVAANKCQSNRAWLLDLDTWVLASNGPAVKIIQNDGLRIRARASADGFECRLVFRGNLGCKAPSHNCNVKLA